MFTAKMIESAKRETQETHAAQWTPSRIAGMRTDALVSANKLHRLRWGVDVQALTDEIKARSKSI